MCKFSNPVMFESVLSSFVQCKRHEMTLMNEVRHGTGIYSTGIYGTLSPSPPLLALSTAV